MNRNDLIGRADFNCWTLVQEMDPSIPDYKELETSFEKVSSPQRGDIVLMEKCDDVFPFHAGFMVGPDSFLHATKKLGVVKGYSNRWPYKGKIIGYYRRGGSGEC